MSRLAAVACVLVLAPVAPAQFPFGHATPVGGSTPSLFAEPLYLGNAGFGYRIRGAPPGGSALVALSTQRQDQLVGGLQVYLDLGGIFVTHSAPVDGLGQALLPFPLPGPDDPGLAGLEVYAQAAVTDPASPGALGTTQAVLLELTLHPVLAYCQLVAGGSYLVDPFTGVASPIGGLPSAAGGPVFGNGGRDLFLAVNDGVYVVDTLVDPPVATNLGVGAGALAWDRVHHRLYVLSYSLGVLKVVDGDRASAGFGTVLTEVPSNAIKLALSGDGSILALVDGSGGLERRISDPASPAYLQPLPTAPSPIVISPPFEYAAGLHLSPDGRVASISVLTVTLGFTTVVHRHDGATNQWIDHGPAAGYQPFTQGSVFPTLPQSFSLFATRDGSALFLSGPFSVKRVGLDLADPSSLAITTTPVAPLSFGSEYVSVSPSGRFLVRRDYPPFNQTGPNTLSLVDVETGAVTPWVTVPGLGGQSSTPSSAWR